MLDPVETEAAGEPQDAAPASSTEEAEEQDEDAAAPAPSTDYLDELYADGLHEGVAPAAPGTAYIEIGGERFEFTTLSCTVNDEPGRGQFIVSASEESTGSGHRLYLSREIGADLGFNFENEHVQFAHLIDSGDDEAMAQYSNSMAQHGRDEGEEPDWLEGAGESPLVRAVGDEATAIGTLAGVMFAEEPLEGDFVAAATCP
ncbi:hypothetical protein ACO0LV_07375 [Pseudactinotalea sp. Z1739]|uniref:hypothetical protein n=1 Tax=Pseudactinotalea sp. Z1739 TaxID=3413028 RepID=UPI003C7E0A7F